MIGSKFPNSKNDVEDRIEDLKRMHLQGDRTPGYGELHIRKVRVGLKAYKISKRDGLRIIFMVLEEQNLIIMVALYYKGDNNNEKKNIKRVKENLKEILEGI